jgi:hypothetical protein
MLAPTCFGSSLPSLGSCWIRLRYMKIQIGLVVYHIMLVKWSVCRGSVCCASQPIIHQQIRLITRGRNSSVGIATRFALDGTRIESRWLRDFPHPPRPSLRPTQSPLQWDRVFPGGKTSGAWRWPPTPSSAEVKERTELYFCPSGPWCPVLRWTLPLPSCHYFPS